MQNIMPAKRSISLNIPTQALNIIILPSICLVLYFLTLINFLAFCIFVFTHGNREITSISMNMFKLTSSRGLLRNGDDVTYADLDRMRRTNKPKSYFRLVLQGRI
jgi:hypothetical protein